MSDVNFTFEYGFAGIVDRDRAKSIVEDWLQATIGTELYESQFANGIEVYNNRDVGGNVGPALLASLRVPDTTVPDDLTDRIDPLCIASAGYSMEPIT